MNITHVPIKRKAINYAKVRQLFEQRNYQGLIMMYNGHESIKRKWEAVIRYVIIFTHDFDFAIKIMSDHTKLHDFFNKYQNLKYTPIEFELTKYDYDNLRKLDLYKQFESYFTNKHELLRILYYITNKETYSFVYLTKQEYDRIDRLRIQMISMNIDHYDYEILSNKAKICIKYTTTYNDNDIIISNIPSKIIIFMIINDILIIDNLRNINNKIIVYSTLITIYKTTDPNKYFNDLCFERDCINELIKRREDFKDINEGILTDNQREKLNKLKSKILF